MQRRLRVGVVVDHARADDVVELLGEDGAVDALAGQLQVGHAELGGQFLGGLEWLLRHIGAYDLRMGEPQRGENGLVAPAAGHPHAGVVGQHVALPVADALAENVRLE
jgi:hypothetical protein